MRLLKELKISNLITLMTLILACFCSLAHAQSNVNLLNAKIRNLPGNRAQIMLEFSAVPPTPKGFSISGPAKMIFDFAGVSNNLNRDSSSQKVNDGVVTAINFVNTEDKTRMIIDVEDIVPYSVDIDRNKIIITLDNNLSFTRKLINQ